jgi:ethanolamine utilization protein EutP (predicted NTPase)
LYKGGVFDSQITESAPSSGSFSWDIPVSIVADSDYTVKITSVNDDTIFDFSDANFQIFEGNITLTNPNGGENWQAGTTQTITWTDNINGNVKIELYKGGTFHSIISTSTGSDGSENWNIPFAQESGTNYRVKITSIDDPSITDESDADFTIIGYQITVVSPNGGEQWLDTDDQQITWTDNLTGNVEIQLIKNDDFLTTITTSTPSDGSYTWNIPDTIKDGSDYKIKILSVEDGNLFDISDADFTIINLTVISPNGGENWQKETTHTISWNGSISGNVKIELYWDINNLETVITPSTPSTGGYNWTIPVQTTVRTDYKVKITSLDYPTLFDFSDDYFGIFEGNITITSPNGGEVWQAGTTRNIAWTDSINENVMIELFKGGMFHSTIETSTSSDGSRNWNIPFTLEYGSDYTIKITSVNNPELFDFSDANFTIVGNEVTVTSPNGGENYLIGTTQIIRWTNNFSSNVEIQLFKGDIFHSSITTSTPSDGEYPWNIWNSLVQGSDYKIRVSNKDYGTIFDFSDADFTLSNEIIITTPNGGESWQRGTTYTISWTDNITENVRIELFKGGSFASEITASTPSTGSFLWDIPISTTPGLDYTVKITSINNSSIYVFSDDNFEIFEGAITVTTPDGGENWKAGTTQSIQWTDNINENVSIDLFKDGVFHSVIETSTSSDGSRNWIIPFTIESGSNYRIKITSVNDPGIFDFSDADFTIVANQITVTSPNGGEVWLETEEQLITWTDCISFINYNKYPKRWTASLESTSSYYPNRIRLSDKDTQCR